MFRSCKNIISSFLNLDKRENKEYILDVLFELCNAIKYGLKTEKKYILMEKIMNIIVEPVPLKHKKYKTKKHLQVDSKLKPNFPIKKNNVLLFLNFDETPKYEILNFENFVINRVYSKKLNIKDFIIKNTKTFVICNNFNYKNNDKDLIFKDINDVINQSIFLFGVPRPSTKIESSYDMYSLICKLFNNDKKKILDIMLIC